MSYDWDQDFHFITIKIETNENITPKDINVEYTPKNIKVFIKNNLYKEGELYKYILPNECSWYLDNNILNIELAKREKRDENVVWHKCFSDEKTSKDTKFNVDFKDLSQKYKMQKYKDYVDIISQ